MGRGREGEWKEEGMGGGKGGGKRVRKGRDGEKGRGGGRGGGMGGGKKMRRGMEG